MKKLILLFLFSTMLFSSTEELKITEQLVASINENLLQEENLSCHYELILLNYNKRCAHPYSLLQEKTQIALDFFKNTPKEILILNPISEISKMIFSDKNIINKEATLEASILFLKEFGNKSFKAIYLIDDIIYEKIPNSHIENETLKTFSVELENDFFIKKNENKKYGFINNNCFYLFSAIIDNKELNRIEFFDGVKKCNFDETISNKIFMYGEDGNTKILGQKLNDDSVLIKKGRKFIIFDILN